MTAEGSAPIPIRYRPPPPDGREPRWLTLVRAADGPRFPFYARLEIGRDDGVRPDDPGLLLVRDPTVSRLHCVVTQQHGGVCLVRDVSRNGTRLDGRRLVPNVETEWRPGQPLAVGSVELALAPGATPAAPRAESEPGTCTVAHVDRCLATVLVGDIRDYTVLVRRALSEDLQRSVGRVFERLSAAVAENGGTVKEYQGDAILAYWEGDVTGRQARTACGAALALDEAARRMARDRAVWAVDDFPLHVDWALCTGLVLIDSVGGARPAHEGGRVQPAGLSMMGEPVVRAFRIEKLADDETGRIVTCNTTRDLAAGDFTFRDLGARQAKGFDRPDRVFALVGPRS